MSGKRSQGKREERWRDACRALLTEHTWTSRQRALDALLRRHIEALNGPGNMDDYISSIGLGSERFYSIEMWRSVSKGDFAAGDVLIWLMEVADKILQADRDKGTKRRNGIVAAVGLTGVIGHRKYFDLFRQVENELDFAEMNGEKSSASVALVRAVDSARPPSERQLQNLEDDQQVKKIIDEWTRDRKQKALSRSSGIEVAPLASMPKSRKVSRRKVKREVNRKS